MTCLKATATRHFAPFFFLSLHLLAVKKKTPEGSRFYCGVSKSWLWQEELSFNANVIRRAKKKKGQLKMKTELKRVRREETMSWRYILPGRAIVVYSHL